MYLPALVSKHFLLIHCVLKSFLLAMQSPLFGFLGPFPVSFQSELLELSLELEFYLFEFIEFSREPVFCSSGFIGLFREPEFC